MPEIAWIQLTAWICIQCLANESGTIIVKQARGESCGHCGLDMMKVKMSCKRFEEEEDAQTNQ